jgi:hypothetical protein
MHSPGSAFFGDFLWRWTKSYPLQPAQRASGMIVFILLALTLSIKRGLLR